MNVLYFGSGAFGLPTLAHLARHHTLLGIVTQPDRPAGRGGKLTPTPVAQWAAANTPDLPIFKPEKVNDPEVVGQLRGLGALGAHAWIVIAFGQKLGQPLLKGVLSMNLHASLLPRWRGAAPINAAILAGDQETGNSVITLADKMDSGLILAQSHRPIDPLVTAGELHDLLAADGPQLIESALSTYAIPDNGRWLHGSPQDESLVTIAPKLTKASGIIDWTARDADEARRLIHAMTPWPGVTVTLSGSPLKLLRARVVPDAPGPGTLPPGSIIDPAAGTVACRGGTTLALLEVQPAGKRPMPWGDFARGRTIPRGGMLVPEDRTA